MDAEMHARHALLDAIDDRIREGRLSEQQRGALVRMLADIAYRAAHDDPRLAAESWADIREGWAELVAAMTEPGTR